MAETNLNTNLRQDKILLTIPDRAKNSKHWNKHYQCLHNLFWINKNLDPFEKVILGIILTYWRYDDPPYLAATVISELSGIGLTKVKQALAHLRDLNYIETKVVLTKNGRVNMVRAKIKLIEITNASVQVENNAEGDFYIDGFEDAESENLPIEEGRRITTRVQEEEGGVGRNTTDGSVASRPHTNKIFYTNKISGSGLNYASNIRSAQNGSAPQETNPPSFKLIEKAFKEMTQDEVRWTREYLESVGDKDQNRHKIEILADNDHKFLAWAFKRILTRVAQYKEKGKTLNYYGMLNTILRSDRHKYQDEMTATKMALEKTAREKLSAYPPAFLKWAGEAEKDRLEQAEINLKWDKPDTMNLLMDKWKKAIQCGKCRDGLVTVTDEDGANEYACECPAGEMQTLHIRYENHRASKYGLRSLNELLDGVITEKEFDARLRANHEKIPN